VGPRVGCPDQGISNVEIRRLSAAGDDTAIKFLRWTLVVSYRLLQISSQNWSCFEVESEMELIKVREFSVLFELV
jgi:hypothetical protein